MGTDVEDLLASKLGFDVHTIGAQVVETVVRKFMEEARFPDPAAYARILAADSELWNRLVDNVVIPETWFFRDIAPFELAADLARDHVRRASDRPLRVLSCPCSTGEEPYSLVMAMLHAGAPAGSFVVDAVDVSRRALEFAQVGVFRTRSFRHETLWYRAPYFDYAETDGSWQLRDLVVSRVRFRQGNLVAPDFLKDETPYDVVFCRNLLIYLHPEARLLAVAALRRLVADEGVLVVGHAEAVFAREHGFKSTGPAAAFALKRSSRTVRKARSGSGPSAPSSVTPRPLPVAKGASPTAAVAPGIAALSPKVPELSLLVSARRLGDAGKLHDALRLCSEYLQSVPDSAEGHFLFGVLQDALGRTESAVRSFRKVLYLDATHREALLHLALKQEALGDHSGAALLRARARRTQDACATD
jgi:chemotaxis protein methyltransferase WspC